MSAITYLSQIKMTAPPTEDDHVVRLTDLLDAAAGASEDSPFLWERAANTLTVSGVNRPIIQNPDAQLTDSFTIDAAGFFLPSIDGGLLTVKEVA